MFIHADMTKKWSMGKTIVVLAFLALKMNGDAQVGKG